MADRASYGVRQTVLVVDDEACVLDLCAAILARAGFEVLRAASAGDALRIGQRRHDRIHLMLCDVVMPLVSGPVLAEQFQHLHSETRYLFMAGFPDNPEITERIVSRGRPFLAKPFLPQTLVQKVREVLDSGHTLAAFG